MTDKTWFVWNKVEIIGTGGPNINLYDFNIIQKSPVSALSNIEDSV